MKIVHFSNLVPDKYGTYESLLAGLADECRRCGDSFVPVLGGEPLPVVAGRFRAAGIEWRVVPGWTDAGGGERPWRFIFPALAIIREIKPDVVVLNFGNEIPAFLAVLLSKIGVRRKIKWIWQQHQQVCDPNPVTSRFSRMRLLALVFDHFVTQYEGGKRSLVRRGIPAERVTSIVNGVPEARRTRPPGWLRREQQLPDDTVVAVTVGSLIVRKRIDFQLQALSLILKKRFPVSSLLPHSSHHRRRS